MTPFNEYWLETGAAVPVDIETTAILLREIQRLRSKEQKPVAFRNTETGDFCTGGFLRKDWAKWQPLYAAPREWIGLTDEDIDLYAVDEGVTNNKAPAWLVSYARGIEAILREKNNAA